MIPSGTLDTVHAAPTPVTTLGGVLWTELVDHAKAAVQKSARGAWALHLSRGIQAWEAALTLTAA